MPSLPENSRPKYRGIPGNRYGRLMLRDINKIRSFVSELIGQPVIKCGDCIDKFFNDKFPIR